MGKRYLIIANISKRHNVMSLIHAAKAYEFIPIMIGGSNLRETLPLDIKESLLWMATMIDLNELLQSEEVHIVGIEIAKDSLNLLEYKFPLNIAIMPGNEGTGLSVKQRDICDSMIYIPHYGEGTASLNVHIATSIVLHHYSLQMNV